MAKFSSENQGNFGVPDVSIEPSLSSIFDPYSGIDLTNINSCDYIEVMTLPSGVSSEEVVCNDPFAANGPAWVGGTGEPGVCRNFGRINGRHLGYTPLGSANTQAFVGYWSWIASCPDGNVSGCTGNPGDPTDKYANYYLNGSTYQLDMGPAFWGYLSGDGGKIEGDPTPDDFVNAYTQYASQTNLSSLNFDLAGNTPPGFTGEDPDRNIAEFRFYWTPNDNDFVNLPAEGDSSSEVFRFAHNSDDWGGFYMDNGCGGELQLGNGGEFTNFDGNYNNHSTNNRGCDSGRGDNNYGGGLTDHDYGWFDKSIRKYCPDTGNLALYRILYRIAEGVGHYDLQTGYQSSAGRAADGQWESYENISGGSDGGQGGGQVSSATGVHNIEPTFRNPISVDGDGLQDDSNGDGQYYRTDAISFGEQESPYYEGTDTVDDLDISLTQEGVRDYVRGINCDTIIDTKISDFNRMRAVCRDGSYVEMANNGDSINNILDPSPIETTVDYLIPTDEIKTGTYRLDSNNNAQIYGTASIPGIPFLDLVAQIKVTKLTISGDFERSDEYVNVTIGNVNLPRLSSDVDGADIVDVGDAPFFIDKDYTGNLGGSDSLPSGAVYIEDGNLKIPMSFNSTSEVDLNISYRGYEYTIDIEFEVTLGQTSTVTVVQGYEDYNFLSGNEACDSITYFNSDLYYLSDIDNRPSLGLFATLDNNVTNNTFESTLADDLFTQINKRQFIENGDGRYVEINNFYKDVSGYESSDYESFVEKVYKPQGGWDYINFDGAGVNITLGNTPSQTTRESYLQHPNNQDDSYIPGQNAYAGYLPYIGGVDYNEANDEDFVRMESLNHPLQWAKWIESNECYSYRRCLKFQADSRWDDTVTFSDLALNESNITGTNTPYLELLRLQNNNEYRTINQYQKFYSSNDTSINPYSSLEISFWMKTMEDALYDVANPPHVQVSVTRGGSPQNLYPHPINNDIYDFTIRLQLDGVLSEDEDFVFGNKNYIDQNGTYNSIHSDAGTTFSKFGTANVFTNSKTNTWEKFTFTFNLLSSHNRSDFNIKNLFLLAQATSINADLGFRGTVLLDNFEVKESYKFMPDVDVRKKKGPNSFGLADLTKYYDKTIEPEIYKDTVAPLEVQFYFYPRYYYEEIFDKSRAIIYNDFRHGMFYIYDIDWGDGSPKEFVNEPQKINEDTAVYHTYETAGIYEVTGTMLRMKPNKDYEPIGVIHNERFVLRIAINEGLDEDFTYFGSDGFSFIPFKNTLPMVGGYSEQSIYYKSIVRTLGILDENNLINTNFESVGDRLKTELALEKIDSSLTTDFELLNSFKQERFNADGSLIYNGIQTNNDEFGKSVGDLDITCIRYFDKPMQIWEMFGFEEVEELSDFVTSDEYLSTLPFPQYFEEFNIIEGGNNILEITDAIRWGELGRPDIAAFVQEVVSENEAIPPSITSESEPGGQGGSTPQPRPFDEFYNLNAIPNQNHYGLLSSPRYWKRIIDEEMIFNRDGLYYENGRTDLINENSNQDWDNVSYYYPTLPKYGADGKFIEDVFPIRGDEPKIPFPLDGPITNESYTHSNLKISINSNAVDSNVLNDDSGNNNYGFVINDYRPKFNNTSLKPNKVKNTSLIKTSTKDGAF